MTPIRMVILMASLCRRRTKHGSMRPSCCLSWIACVCKPWRSVRGHVVDMLYQDCFRVYMMGSVMSALHEGHEEHAEVLLSSTSSLFIFLNTSSINQTQGSLISSKKSKRLIKTPNAYCVLIQPRTYFGIHLSLQMSHYCRRIAS